MVIIADNKIPFLNGALEPFADVVYASGKDITNELIRQTDAEALIIRTRTKCNHELLRETKVSFIATATIGYDHIDTDYCNKNGIFWTNAPGCNSSSVQQYIASALVTLANNMNFNLRDKTLGVVGVGNVGSKVVRLAEALNMTVIMNDPPRQRKENHCQMRSLDTVLIECDIITFHVPLNLEGTDKTFHMADTSFFEQVRSGTIIINSSRGEVIESTALKQAVKSGKIAAAVLDVWENEPVIDKELMSLASIATPHIAGYSADGKANGTTMSVRALSRFFNLGIDDWVPAEIPVPSKTTIHLKSRGKSDDAIIREAIMATYNIMDDDARLRGSVETFEKQRGSYPLRREFHVYDVFLSDERPDTIKRLKKLGFKVNNNLNT
ncbi:MAG: 4-phosphoerythronate dehydrogenase PdxB [Bacteroidales bacterium]|nr:4-phosphoerythronate dehydrogenase PdxB [Bacteroidales bacterium]